MREIKEFVFQLDGQRAAGPDGFTGLFVMHCLDIISFDLVDAVNDFWAGVPIPRVIASTLIVLIPKKDTFA